MVPHTLPRFVRAKRLANGGMGFSWELTGYYRKLGCSIHGEPLGNDYVVACGVDGNGGRAAALNALFDEWRAIRAGQPVVGLVKFGTNRLAIPRIQANESLSRKGFETVAP